MQKDQFCNLTRDIHTPGLLLKLQVATYMQLVGWEWTIFDFFNSYLALGLGGIKQKNVLFIAEPQDDFFCFIPSRKFFWFQFLFVPYQSSRRKSPALSDSPVHPLPHPHPHPPPPLRRPHFNITKMKSK